MNKQAVVNILFLAPLSPRLGFLDSLLQVNTTHQKVPVFMGHPVFLRVLTPPRGKLTSYLSKVRGIVVTAADFIASTIATPPRASPLTTRTGDSVGAAASVTDVRRSRTAASSASHDDDYGYDGGGDDGGGDTGRWARTCPSSTRCRGARAGRTRNRRCGRPASAPGPARYTARRPLWTAKAAAARRPAGHRLRTRTPPLVWRPRPLRPCNGWPERRSDWTVQRPAATRRRVSVGTTGTNPPGSWTAATRRCLRHHRRDLHRRRRRHLHLLCRQPRHHPDLARYETAGPVPCVWTPCRPHRTAGRSGQHRPAGCSGCSDGSCGSGDDGPPPLFERSAVGDGVAGGDDARGPWADRTTPDILQKFKKIDISSSEFA